MPSAADIIASLCSRNMGSGFKSVNLTLESYGSDGQLSRTITAQSKTGTYGQYRKHILHLYYSNGNKALSLLTHVDDRLSTTRQWINLADRDLKKELYEGQRYDNVMASDFTLADLAPKRADEETHTLIKEDDANYYMRSIPRSKDCPLSKIDRTIDKKTNISIKTRFYGNSSQGYELLREMQAQELATVDGDIEPTVLSMKTIKSGSRTVMTLSHFDFKTKIDEAEFAPPV